MNMMTDDAFVRLFQERAGLTPDGWAGRDTLAKLDELAPPKADPVPIADSGIPDGYWPMLSRIESADRPYVKAETSSASGLFQFIKRTWLGEGGKWGTNMALAFGGLQPSPAEQLMRVKTLAAKDAAQLRKAGIPINKASLYACHFLGWPTAIRIINGDVKERADLIAGEGPTKANPSILRGKTVGEFLSWLNKKTGDWAR